VTDRGGASSGQWTGLFCAAGAGASVLTMGATTLEQPGANVIPVPAATAVMIRDADHGLETWMMRRARAMAFAPGAVVFPGGRVDPRDADVTVPWLGAAPETVAKRMGTDPRPARELVTAAVRELFGEASTRSCSVLHGHAPSGRRKETSGTRSSAEIRLRPSSAWNAPLRRRCTPSDNPDGWLTGRQEERWCKHRWRGRVRCHPRSARC
jgi:hypothetical protein